MTKQFVEARFVELETRSAFQEDAIAQLNDALIAQQKRIDILEAQLQMLRDELQTVIDGPEAPRDPRDEIPPHY